MAQYGDPGVKAQAAHYQLDTEGGGKREDSEEAVLNIGDEYINSVYILSQLSMIKHELWHKS